MALWKALFLVLGEKAFISEENIKNTAITGRLFDSQRKKSLNLSG